MRAALILLLLSVLLPGGAARAETLRFGTAAADRQAAYLDMGDERISDWEAFYAFLSEFPALRKVDLFATEIRGGRIEELTGKFPEISFGMTMRIQDHTVRTDATAFSTLHNPDSPPHGESDFSPLRYCTRLYALDLGHNRLTDLSFLRELAELRVLIVAMNRLEDISPVGELRHLEYLEIFDNDITDLSCLAGLPYLTDLNLAGNSIEDPGPIMKMTGLKRLWMSFYNRKLTPEQIRETAAGIRAALPDCEVDEASPGVEGAWRSHPHYEVIRRIFSSGVYEPFEDSPAENRP